MIDLDLDILLREVIKRRIPHEQGEEEATKLFNQLSKLVTEYSEKSKMPEDGVMLTVIDSISSGMGKEDIITQLRVLDSKRREALT